MNSARFNADVRAAAARASEGNLEGVSSVSRGDCDGEVALLLPHATQSSPVRIRALAQDLNQYPDASNYMLFTDNQDVPPAVLRTISTVQDFAFGKKVVELALDISRSLAKELGSSISQSSRTNNRDQTDSGYEDISMTEPPSETDSNEGYNDDEAWGLDFDDDDDDDSMEEETATNYRSVPSEGKSPLLKRMKRDIRASKMAGFKIGLLEGVRASVSCHLLSLSIRANKLALSEEAMQAWDIESLDYIVLLVRCPGPYVPFERVIELPTSLLEMQFRVGKCKRCKPSTASARAAFLNQAKSTANQPSEEESEVQNNDHSAEFSKIFISNSLNRYMAESFLAMVKLREGQGLSWDKANERLLRSAGLVLGEHGSLSEGKTDAIVTEESVEEMVTYRAQCLNNDHLRQAGERSLPLIAMQFAMRHFVRCTEFCLRCHRRVNTDFESLKPYVCSDPLCLFQYMALGLGPSIEHEIIAEPLVVDLLVSFCYASVQGTADRQYGPTPAWRLPIREFPTGLRLRVPQTHSASTTPQSSIGAWGLAFARDFPQPQPQAQAQAQPPQVASGREPIRAVFGADDASLTVDSAMDMSRLKTSAWIAVVSSSEPSSYSPELVPTGRVAVHGRIARMSLADRTLVLDNLSYSGFTAQPNDIASFLALDKSRKVMILPYEIDFDALSDVWKGQIIPDILDTLPSIAYIREKLLKDSYMTLRQVAGVSPTAEGLLRWIISSNRSCIFQVTDQIGDFNHSRVGKSREDEIIPGMGGFLQFRFAQGAPDKEIRFQKQRREVTARKRLQYPSIYAWHGSNVANWHSIVRNGLDFVTTRNGRAYGHGVYFSQQYATSLGYSSTNGGRYWPNSVLRVHAAMSLNEVVNAPDEFVSRSPHYVVAQPDWHQCRYLFVQPRYPTGTRVNEPRATLTAASSSAPTIPTSEQEAPDRTNVKLLDQDPTAAVAGPNGSILQIPLAAVSSASKSDVSFEAIHQTTSQAPGCSGRRGTKRPLEDDTDEEDVEDIEFLFSDSEKDCEVVPRKVDDAAAANDGAEGEQSAASAQLDVAGTDFRPGALDLTSLPRTAPPVEGGRMALKSLSHEAQRLQKIQDSTPPRDLGWYIDFEQTTNLFQWIVELHSFEKDLPLAIDMRNAGVTSIVLEVRFGVQFPITPPFVRVIRPRFLPFQHGGGGHVTAGGAMCMELLTNSGWSPVSSMEGVILQVRMAIESLKPKPARLENMGTAGRPMQDYGIGEAIAAYERAARQHGWEVPQGFRDSLK